MSIQFRIVLPTVVGGISLPLMIWDIHNERVIESMGMAWDTGAPVWPYQTPDLLLRFLNGPAYFVAQPLANVFRLGGPSHFLVVFPAVLIWWWFLGVRLDSGWATVRSRWRWPVSAVLAISAVALLCAAIVVSADTFHWWVEYGSFFRIVERSLLIMRFLSPAVWCAGLSLLLAVGAKRISTSSARLARRH
jgi:hypothetical protein